MTLEPLLPVDAIRIFFDGTVGDPQLDHPECVDPEAAPLPVHE